MQRKQKTKAKNINKRGETSAINTQERGITLIALIVTIIVLIVLAVVSINAIFGADGLVAQARRTDLIVEFTVYLEEKKTYDSEKRYENSNYDAESLNAGRTTLAYNTQEGTGGNIQTVIPSMDDEYAGMFEIIKGEFYLYAASDLEREVATELGIEVSPYLIDDGVLLSSNVNLGLQTENGVVILPERVTEIGAGAFSGVTGLKEVTIPGTVKVIQQDAFSYNTEIEKVTIKDGVLSIGRNAFRECTSLKEVTMPDSVIEVGDFAFYGCTNLTTVQLSNNLTSLEKWSFALCTNLTTINIPNNMQEIVDYAFGWCRKLDNIHIPAGVTSISSTAFSGNTGLYNLTIDEANTVYEVEDGIIYKKDNSTLIMLGTMAEAETVTIREGIQSLEEQSLAICTSMTTLNLPNSLNNISGSAFMGLSILETINFPRGNNTYMIEDGYLYNKDGKELIYVVPTKKTISINEDVETIKRDAICNGSIIELIIPDNVKTLEGAFLRNTYALKKIYIGVGVSHLEGFTNANLPNGWELIMASDNPYYKVEGNLILTKDGKEVVTFINKVQSQTIPEGVEKLQEYAFNNFTTVIEIKLPNTLKEIGSGAFNNCTSIVEIQIPSSVEIIANNAFSNCSNLAEIRIDKEKNSIAGSPWSVPKGEKAIIWLE